MLTKLEIVLLGRFDLRLDGETIDLASRPQKKLLTYLVLNAGQAIPRAKLAGTLWLDSPERTARKNLRHHLWRLRQAIGGEYLSTTKDTVAFKAEANYHLDVEVLEQAPADGDLEALIEAISVYQGELLPGFYDDWLLLERERLQAVFERQMQVLLDHLAAEARWSDLITWAEHWIAQAHSPEPAYRALMTGAAGLGDLAGAARHYQRCQKALQEELGVEPSAETLALFERLTSRGQQPAQETTYVPEMSARLPAFLQDDVEPERPVFVGRQAELDRLNGYLEAALSGQGQAAFLAGDAGSGKTSMMRAFAAQASEFYPDLLVAWGTCNAFGGLGDPFLPFRKVLAMLTGDVEEAWSAAAITTEQARRLWAMMPVTAKTLLDYSPDLPDAFIPVAPLVNRLELALLASQPMLAQLRDRAAQQIAAAHGERPQLLEQVTALLRRLAEQRPLILLLDDLQWADRGSIELLFYLGRSLSGTRLLLLSAYRPDEIAAAENHPLGPVLSEFRRSFGDVWLDLDESPGRAFVDDIIDSEANCLGEGFREKLFQRTSGHALFTVELLRDLQERGDLIKDDTGAWTVGPTLNWDVLPARVKGALQSRLGRLNQELRDILKVAAVEGEVFTAQVVAQVQALAERPLLRILSRELGERHKLIREEWGERAGRQKITHYRFAHQMYQRYLYNDLSEMERRLLHDQVGETLETLYEDKSDKMVAQLARHFDEAGNSNKAVTYLLAAGDRARSLYVNEEAIEHYRRALEHLRDLGNDERLARTWMRLGLTYHNAFDYQRSRQAYEQGFTVWRNVGADSQEHLVDGTLRVWLVGPDTLDPPKIPHRISSTWVRQLFSGLVELSDRMVVVPDLARRWEIDEGGLTYVFHLRENAKWSDGHLLTAADFVLAWRRVLDPNAYDFLAEQLYDIRGAQAYHLGQSSDENQLGLRTPDDHTLIVELEKPASYFLHLLAAEFAQPVPQHKIAELGDSWADPEQVVTNGPFIVTSWSPGQVASLIRNPHYHGVYGGNVSRVEALITDTIEGWEKAMTQYAQGDVDLLEATLFPGDAFSGARAQFGENYFNMPNWTTYGIAFNPTVSPVNDVRLRRALAMAIDRDQLVGALSIDQATPAHGGWIPYGLPGHSPRIGLPFDPPVARRLLAEAGLLDGNELSGLEMVWPDNQFNREQGAFLAKLWLTHLGITVRPLYLQYDEWLECINRDPPAMYFSGWSADYPDPDNFVRPGSGLGSKYNERFVEIIDAARVATDQRQRLALYCQADKLLIEEALIIPITYGLGQYLVSSRVRRFPATLRWRDIIVDPD